MRGSRLLFILSLVLIVAEGSHKGIGSGERRLWKRRSRRLKYDSHYVSTYPPYIANMFRNYYG